MGSMSLIGFGHRGGMERKVFHLGVFMPPVKVMCTALPLRAEIDSY